MVNSSADTSWNDWPKHKTFVPWLHGLGRQVAPGGAHIHAAKAMSLLAAEELEVNIFGVHAHKDAEIAETVVNALRWHVWVPKGIQAVVENGYLDPLRAAGPATGAAAVEWI